MIYQSAVQQIKGVRGDNVIPDVCLAKVASLSDGRAYVQFYGESAPSTKLYPYIEGYKPTVNDNVLMVRQGETFIIAGKISKDNISDNYYLLKSAADAAYLTEAEADQKYQPIGTSTASKWIENDRYYVGFLNTTTNIVQTSTKTSTSTKVDFGTSSNRFGTIYAESVNLTSGFGDITTGSISASGNNKNIGTSSTKFSNGYITSLYPSNIYGGKWYYNSSTGNVADVEWSTNGTIVGVLSSGNVNLGTSSRQFGNVYAKQFYQNGTAISTSDRRKKTGIKDIARKYISFFRRLKPRLFRFKDGESGRLHSGFIAQEVEEAAIDSGIDNKDLAFLCIDENGDYGLRYEELIAIQTKVIQDLMDRVEDLERIVKGGA